MYVGVCASARRQKISSRIKSRMILTEKSTKLFYTILKACFVFVKTWRVEAGSLPIVGDVADLRNLSGAGFFRGRPRGRLCCILLSDQRCGFKIMDFAFLAGSILTPAPEALVLRRWQVALRFSAPAAAAAAAAASGTTVAEAATLISIF